MTTETMGAQLEARVQYVHNPTSNIIHAVARINGGPRLSAEGCNLDDAANEVEYPSLHEVQRKIGAQGDSVKLCEVCVLPALP